MSLPVFNPQTHVFGLRARSSEVFSKMDRYHYHTPRQAMKTAEFQQQMKQRNAIEGTHSELVRAHGLRRARYRGLNKVALRNYLIRAACNVIIRMGSGYPSTGNERCPISITFGL